MKSTAAESQTAAQRILVTGATGAIGPVVVHELVESGVSVRCFSLDPAPPGLFPEGVEEQVGDLDDRASLDAAFQHVDAVIHMAALLHRMDNSPDWAERCRRVNVGGTERVIDCCLKYNVRRLVFFSTIAVYGSTGPEPVTEVAPTAPDTPYAETKLMAERAVLDATRSDGKPLGCVLRMASVYGARVKGNYRLLLHALARRRHIPIGRGGNRRTLVYDRDAARAAVLAMEHDAAAGGLFNVTDGQIHSMRDIVAAMCRALERRPPRLFIPELAARQMARAAECAGSMLRPSMPPLQKMVAKYLENVAVDGSLIQEKLGFRPETDLQAGWRETAGRGSCCSLL